ncbi:type II toxin-antitoxin system VapC family toxin [Acrocarpospora sp. B8E8]|uniref:type II toxin-antitoxin system VapC family toxin n=1 Tax=Acrocarpospora sp. B8E8 TaxID=3153572 RepID=UPI00325F5777
MLYLDTSALAKLAHIEIATRELEEYLSQHMDSQRVSSSLVEVELPRAINRANPAALIHVPGILAHLDLLEIDATVRADAAALPPPTLGSLDAIHLATALELAADLEAFLTYDKGLANAAESAGLVVESPGMSL